MSLATALQAALAVEHQVVYGYGVAGAHLRAGARRLALRELTQHQVARDRLTSLIRRDGQSPVPASPAYRTPFPVDDTAGALRLLVLLEDSAAGVMWDVVAASRPATAPRRHAVAALAAAASAGQRWRLESASGAVTLPPPLPGQPDD